MSNKFRTVNFIFSKTNNYGLLKDCRLLESYFAKCQFRCQRLDPHEPPKPADINVHLEVPIYANIAWAPVNLLLVNPEYFTDAFESYADAFDALIIRDSLTYDLYYKRMTVTNKDKLRVMPFTTPTNFADIKMPMTTDAKWLWIIGGSKHKIAAAKALLTAMEDGDQPVKIITSAKDELQPFLKANCQIADKEYDDEQLAREQKTTAGHIVVSEAEGFSHVNAEAWMAGAFRLGTQLPPIIESSFLEDNMMAYIGSLGLPDKSNKYYKVSLDSLSKEQVRSDWIKAQERLASITIEDRKRVTAEAEENRKLSELSWISRIKEWKALAEGRSLGARHVPPVIEADSCPMISIVTPTYNRRDMIELCFHNLLWSDYPIEKIQWIVVEDSDDLMKGASDKLVEFAEKAKGLDFTYIPLQGRRSVGHKRNVGCDAAKHDIILFMDDDDHYPPTSFRRRVSWLTKPLDGRPAASVVGCTMIAMYDLKRGTSAVNVPPWALPLGQRVSEASLAFRKSFWQDRPFADVKVAEGEEWLAGREAAFLEIPPQQIIVAFSHGNNSCSRRIPDDAPVSCFWNFSPQYLTFVHGLAGVKVELQDASKASGPGPKGSQQKAKKK